MINFIIPEGLRIVQSKLQVTSHKIIPTFDSSWCEDAGRLTNSTSYSSNSTNADFILFMGAINDPNESFLAYSSFCLIGILTSHFLIF